MLKQRTRILLSTVLVISMVIFVMPTADAAYGDVTTYAGSPVDTTVAVSPVYFDFPEDIVRDASGNIYIADTYNNAIRKRAASTGAVSVLAGNGGRGATNGTGTAARFNKPRGIAIDSSGTFYVADTDNHVIRKVTSGGVVTTLVSSGLSSPHGVRVYGSTLYIADSGNNAIKYVATSGGTLGTLTTSLNDPRRMDVSTDGSTLYVADNGNHRIVAVNTSSGAVSVVAGSGTSGYKEGIGTAAQFENVWGVALDGNDLYVSDHDNWTIDRIRKINLSTRQTSLLYQDTRQNEMIYPSGLFVTGNDVYVVNAGMGTIHRFNKNDGNSNSLIAGTDRFGNRNGSAGQALFGRPYDLVRSHDGEYLYVAENNKIRKVDLTSNVVSHVIGSSVDNYRGEGTDQDTLPVRFSTIQGITINSSGTRLYVVDRWNNRIRGINLQANPVSSFLVTGAGLINTRGDDNNGYQEGARCGETVQTTGVSGCAYFRAPSGITIDPTNTYLYVADTGNNRIRKVRIADGQTWLVAGSGQAGFTNGTGSAASFNRPFGVAVDASGANLYVADSNNHAIRKINLANNSVSTVVGNGTAGYQEAVGSKAYLSYPEYVKVGADGMVYFTESGSQRVRLVDPTSALTKLVAGSGTTGYVNGGQSAAAFDNLKGLAPDTEQEVIYVADSWNDTIRKISITGSAPYSEPAPTVRGVSPSTVNPSWNTGSGLMVAVNGTNFRHGAVVYFADYQAEKTYVQSGTSLAVRLPLDQLQPGWYDVTVINLDTQKATGERLLGITNSSGVVPDTYYQTSHKSSSTVTTPASTPAIPTAEGTSFFAYDSSLRAGFFVGAGNVLGDSQAEVVTGTGEGAGPHVRVLDAAGRLQAQFFAYDSSLRNGVRVTTCDVDGDGTDEIVTVPGRGGWPLVRIFSGNGTVVNNGFYVLDGKFSGGVNLSCGDVNGDGTSEVIVAAARGGGPHVMAYTVTGQSLVNFMAYDQNFRGGINVTTADLDGDGRDEIVTGPMFGTSHVQLFQIRPNEIKRLSPGFFAFHTSYRGGIAVAGVDTDGDGTKELVVGVGEDAQPHVKVYNIREQFLKQFYAYATTFTGGLNLAGGDVDGDGADELLVVPRSNGGPQVRVINVDEVQ